MRRRRIRTESTQIPIFVKQNLDYPSESCPPKSPIKNHKHIWSRRRKGKKVNGDSHVGNGKSETGERMRSFGRSRLRRRKEQEFIDKSAEIFTDGLLKLLGNHKNPSET